MFCTDYVIRGISEMGEGLGELLVYACIANNVEVVSECLENGARADKKALDGRTLLGLAAEKGHCEVMSLLLKNNDSKSPASDSIMIDCDSSDYPAVYNGNVTPDGMSELEWDGEMFENFCKSDVESDPAIGLYIWYADILEKTGPLLLEIQDNVDAEDAFGRKALHYAAKAGHLDAVDLLLQSGHSVNSMDKNNRTPLYYAVETNRPDILKRLLDDGAHHHVTPGGWTELHLCAAEGYLECAQLLIAAGWSVNATYTSTDFTPLHLAVRFRKRKFVQLLINSNARINACTISEKTALNIALENKDLETSKILVRAGARISKITCFYRLLTDFISKNNMELVEVLLQGRGNISLDLEVGFENPLWSALDNRNYQMVQLLLQHGASLSYKSSSGSLCPGTRFLTQLRKRLELGCQEMNEFLDLFEMYGWEPDQKDIIGMPFHTAWVVIRRLGELSYATRFGLFNGVLLRHPEIREPLRCMDLAKNPTLVNNKWCYQPLSLQDYTRNCIRKSLKRNIYRKIDTLPIPKRIKTFLKCLDFSCWCDDPSLFYMTT